jgi:hypothetical protein
MSAQYKIKVRNNNGILQPSHNRITVKNLETIGKVQLTDLFDVKAVDVSTGSTLVYNSNNNFYEIKKLDFEFMVGDIDGGEF